ncbi:MAG: CDP-diacylglycerol--glycerol-3-phosphate 3-phosphatidyltransferase, partial [Bauldia litoralis]
WVCLALFALASFTDFLDGWLARARDQITDFGRFLDPIADKILVAAALVMLAASGRLGELGEIAAVIILCREFVIAGLREFLAGDDVAVPVSQLAKWKTAAQMVAIGFLLVGPGAPEAVPAVAIGEGLLWLAAALTVITGAGYLRAGIARISGSRPGA